MLRAVYILYYILHDSGNNFMGGDIIEYGKPFDEIAEAEHDRRQMWRQLSQQIATEQRIARETDVVVSAPAGNEPRNAVRAMSGSPLQNNDGLR